MNKRRVSGALVLLLLFSLAACAPAERTPEERVSAVVETIYNCPDKYHRKHFSELSEGDVKALSDSMEAWTQYNKSRFYAEDFEEGLLDKLVIQWTKNVIFPEQALLRREAQLTVANVAVEPAEKNGNLYHFTATVALQDRQGNETNHKVTGNARVNEEGKISEFRILDNEDLMTAIAPPPPAPAAE